MPAKADYYELLGVSRDANGETLKRAYRKLAMECHPDRNPGDAKAEHKFKEISEAYSILSDEQKRAAYDRFGHGAFEQGGMGGFDFGFSGGLSDILEEVFGEFMGGARPRSTNAPQRGRDLRHDMEITLEESFSGVEKDIRVASLVPCETCKGSGAKQGTHPTICRQCAGAGKVRLQQGFFLIERSCPVCHGGGKVIEHPCTTCHGQGRQHKEQQLQVTIPCGVDQGTRIRVAGKGEAGLRGGPNGDLYVFMAIKPHAFFHREGANLLVRIPVSLSQAALGGKLEVPTLSGEPAELSLPEGTQSGAQFRLKSLGMNMLQQARVRGEPQRGDLFVEISVETPINLSKKQRELLKEFEQAGEIKKNNPQAQGFLERMKTFLGVKQ
ncbi:MAG: molecular chaperone DnaJ [Proteobacteria bacterium]|nr:molecular chaperone DnaJ [Pseudomonadota bacterium]